MQRFLPAHSGKGIKRDAGLEIHLKSGRNGHDKNFEDAVIATLVSQGLTTTTGKTALIQVLKSDEKAKSPQISTERLFSPRESWCILNAS